MAITELTYKIEMQTDEAEVLELEFELWGGEKSPRITLEIPAFKQDGVVTYQAQRIHLTRWEFETIAEHFKKYISMVEGVKS